MPRTAYAIDADRQLQVDVLSSGAPPTGASATQVQGAAANGAAAVGNPVYVGGLDGATLRAALVKALTVGNAMLTVMARRTGSGVDDATAPDIATTEADSTAGLYFLSPQLQLTGGGWQRVRAVDTNKTALSTGLAVNTDLAVWTPAAGKKVRLRRLTITATGLTAGDVIEVRDSATVIRQYVVQGTTFQVVEADDANGVLSAAANNVLNVRHVTTAASIRIAVNASGNEE